MPPNSIVPIAPGAGAIKYSDLKDTYQDLRSPVAKLLLGDKEFNNSGKDFVVGEIHVELTSGFEASIATFRLFDVFDKDGKFEYETIKKFITLGNSVSIQLGYTGAVKTVFIGFIAGISFGYQLEELPYIEVTAMDVKGLMMGGSYANQLKATTYSAAVKEVLNRTGEGSFAQSGGITGIHVDNTPDAGGDPARVSPKPGSTRPPIPTPLSGGSGQKSSPVEMVAESDYEFVVRAAKRFNFEFFVDRGDVIFRPAKNDSSILMELGARAGITTFHIEHSITGVVGEIQARAMDAAQGKVISSKKEYGVQIPTASQSRKLVGKGSKVYLDASIKSQEDADARVASLMERMSYRLASLEADCVGIPDLVPGRFIRIVGMGSPVDNAFYLTNVVHDLSGDGGFVTHIKGCAAAIETQSAPAPML